MSSAVQRFFSCKRFAVVGANADRAKFGNKVLRKYMEKGLEVVPVHPSLKEIEGLQVQQLDSLNSPEEVGISLVTPPPVSLKVIEKARSLGMKRFWLQPGAESKELLDTVSEWNDIEVIAGGPCVLVSLDRGEHLQQSKL